MKKVYAIDFETYLIAQGKCLPKIVCGVITHEENGEIISQVFERDRIVPAISSLVRDKRNLIVGHNIAFDMGCLANDSEGDLQEIFDAYEDDRIVCTMLREQLIDLELDLFRTNENGVGVKDRRAIGYSLAASIFRNYGREVAKEDTWRLRYAELDGILIEDYPEDAKHYVDLDGRFTLALYQSQEERKELHKLKGLSDQFRQSRRFFAYQLSAAWGLNIEQSRVDKVEEYYDREYENLLEELKKPVTAKTPISWDEGDEDSFLLLRDACELRLAKEKPGAIRTKVLTDLMMQRDELAAKKEAIDAGQKYLEKAFVLVRESGQRDTKAAKEYAEARMFEAGKEALLTEGGAVSLSKENIDYYEDETLSVYADFSSFGKKRSTDIKLLRSGEDGPIHMRYLLATTGRVRTKPNVQNWPQKNGMRECLVPRSGYVLAQADWEGLELRTLAQICLWILGESRLAEVLNAGEDPHTIAAADILGIDLETSKELKKIGDPNFKIARDTGKIMNFGCGGGMGVSSFLRNLKKKRGIKDEDLALEYGDKVLPYQVMMLDDHEWCRRNFNSLFPSDVQLKAWARSWELIDTWKKTWAEMPKYFAYCRSQLDHEKHYKTKKGEEYEKDVGDFQHPYSGRVRAGIPYSEFCNNPFQGLGADVSGEVSWRLAKACYTQPQSPLFGSRVILSIHDEFICETPEEKAHEAALELSRIMVDTAKEIMPDVPHAAPPLLMRYWSKGAFELRDDNNRLVPWNGEGSKETDLLGALK